MTSERVVVMGSGSPSIFFLKTTSVMALFSLSWSVVRHSSSERLSSALTNWLSTDSSVLLMKCTQKSKELVQL